MRKRISLGSTSACGSVQQQSTDYLLSAVRILRDILSVVDMVIPGSIHIGSSAHAGTERRSGNCDLLIFGSGDNSVRCCGGKSGHEWWRTSAAQVHC